MERFTFICHSSDDTQNLAQQLGQHMRGGETLEFFSDIGGGKTTFVKGLAKGMGITTVVQSPTFTLSQIHSGANNLELHHFDFYRLQDAGIMRAELAESLHQNNAVVAIEWGAIVHDILPKNALRITITAQDTDTRQIIVECSKEANHLINMLSNLQQKETFA